MFGKEKKDKDVKQVGGRQRGGRGGDKPKQSGLAGLMGMDPSMGAGGDDDNDFEAELAKLTGMGGKSGKAKKESNKKQLTTAQLDKIQKQLEAGDDLDLDDLAGSGSDISDTDLLAELEELNLEAGGEDDNKKSDGESGEDDVDIESELNALNKEIKSEAQQKPVKQAPPPPTNNLAKASTQSPLVKEITERIANYQEALVVSEREQATSKTRRLKRGLGTLQDMLTQANKGAAINVDDIPPPVITKISSVNKGPVSTSDETDELAKMADEMTDVKIAPKPAPRASKPSPPPVPPSNTVPNVIHQSPKQRPPIETPLISLDDDFEIPTDELQRLTNDVTPAPKPPVSTRSAPPPPQPRPRPTQPPITLSPDRITRDKVREFLSERQTQYKQAAAIAKQKQQTDKMRQYLKYSLNFNKVISALDEGNPISLDAMPQAPEGFSPSFLLSISSWPIQQNQLRKPSASEPPQTRSESPPPESDPAIPVPSTLLGGLQQRLEKYKEGVVKAEQEGNSSKARRMKRVLAQFQEAITACKAGKPYEYNELPVPPGYPPLPPPGARRPPQTAPVSSSSPQVVPVARPPVPVPTQSGDSSPAPDTEEPLSYNVGVPKTILEGLQQRLAKYQEGLQQAQKDEASSKIRRMNRIVMQYQEAITATKKGVSFDYDDLPVPPGYPPLPGTGHTTAQAPVAPSPAVSKVATHAPPPQGASRGQLQKVDEATYEEQLRVLNSRIDEFRGLAIRYKKEEKLEQAKKYLIYMKGLEPMLELAKSGIRVDLTQVPPSTQVSMPAVKRMTDLKKASDKDVELFAELEESCNKQIDLCKTSAAQCRAIMEIGKANQFENLLEQCKRDLMNLKSARDHGYAPPAYHYEARQIPTFNINPEIEPDQCEISVVRCINIPLPKDYESKDLDCYVTFDFPFPSHEEPQTLSTKSIKGTTSPEFNDPKLFKIDRGKIKSFMRTCKRHPLKITIYYKKGLLRRGEVIGTCSLNLSALSTKAEIHESLTIMDGRKQTSCKMEIQIRLKEPLESKEVLMENHSWLVLDEFVESSKIPMITAPRNLRQKQPVATSTTAQPQQQPGSGTFISPAKVEDTPSIEALKLELQLIVSNQEVFKSKGKPVPAELISRQTAIVTKVKYYQTNLAIPVFKKSYIAGLQAQIVKENEIAASYMQNSKVQIAEHYIKRKKLMTLEYQSLLK
ncbi:Coiled-coil and C2 domain-containing protein 1-like [Oopsacas minuta]|uniref:Coiled-coil and C2 domain-containing protein 1-like n=1 Tax=Oopsacas minuta TaxID=111878 RepID=A0AAV7KAR9_9METZ|nr:Coiled-coil and C2 domain-containing protein 1-like [Oopsacas minuta]